MGYYSNVIICIPKADYDEVIYHSNCGLYESLCHSQSRRVNAICSGIDWTILYFDDIKWYDSYWFVSEITKWYKGLPEYQFYRLGEEFGDYEGDNHSGECNLFYPSQSLDVNF